MGELAGRRGWKEIFDLVKALAQENSAAVLRCIEPADLHGALWNTARLGQIFDEYFKNHQRIRLDPEARASKHTHITDEDPRKWVIEQVLVDPDDLMPG